jgi:O-antigen ligase
LTEEGSHFAGTYVFYEGALFIAAALALAAFNRFNDPDWKRAVLIMVPSVGMAHLAIALTQGERPLLGSFVNPNYFASYLLPGLAAALALSAFARTPTRLCALGAMAFLGYGIVETASRGAALAALAMLGVAAFRWRLRAFGAVATVAALGAVYVVAPQTTVIRKFLDRGEGDPYNYARPMIWKGALEIAASHPLLGAGPGRYAYASKRFTPAIEGTVARYRKFPNMAHSEYLQSLAENGIPAATLMILLLAFVGRRLWTRAPDAGEETMPFQVADIVAVVGVGAHSLVYNNWKLTVLD